MANDGMTTPSQPIDTELTTQGTRSQQRQQLAQRIGRLLADTWLKRRRESETDETLGGDASTEVRAN